MPTFGCGHVHHGAWCEDCNLPSAATFTVYEITDDGVKALGDVTYCRECDDWELAKVKETA